ncbi:MAG: hypothetical protein WC333_00780 [Dehalococcoidia bacterium]|jgi:hypothetical protein
MKLIERENGPALVLFRKIEKLRRRKCELEIEIQLTPPYRKRDKVAIEIERCLEELPKICTHSEKKTVCVTEGGDYYNRTRYIRKTVCAICGEELDQEVTLGGYG